MSDVRKIAVTKDNLWFLQKQISVFDFLEFFPEDSIGASDEKDNDKLPYKVKYLTITTDAGFSFVTDIPRDKMILRARSRSRPGTGKWMVERGVKEGDYICFEKIGEYEYRVYKESPQTSKRE